MRLIVQYRNVTISIFVSAILLIAVIVLLKLLI